MGWVKLQDSTLTSIAGSIRNKLGVQTQYLPSAMPAAIDSIPSGGGNSCTVVINAPTGSTVTLTKGSTTLTATEVSGTWTFTVTEAGTWTATAVYNGSTYTGTVVVEFSKTRILTPKAYVTGLGNESAADVSIAKQGGFPSSFEEWTDSNGNVFVKIPTIYRKVNRVSSSQLTAFEIATAPLDDDYHPYSCFVAPDGTTVLPYVCIGKYCSTSNSVMNSVGGTPVAQTIDNARINARALGSGYQLYDWQLQKLFQDLAFLNYGSINFNNGRGVSEYLGICHLDRHIFIDGVSYIYVDGNSQWVYAKNPANYKTSATTADVGYSLASYQAVTITQKTGSYTIKALGYNPAEPFFTYHRSAYSSSSNVYYYDKIEVAGESYSSYTTISSNVGGTSAYYGLYNTCHGTASASKYARLCYRPISA